MPQLIRPLRQRIQLFAGLLAAVSLCANAVGPLPGMPRVGPLAAQAPGEFPTTDASALLAAPADDGPTLSRIRERGRIVLGYRQTAIPFSYVDGNDAPTGLAWAMCQRIVLALQRELAMPELRVTPVRVIEQMRAPMLRGEAIDIDCAPSTVTAARARQVAFSLPYYASDIRLMVRQGSGIDSIDHLRGLRLAVVQGTTAERIVRARHARAGFQLLMARDYADAFRMLRERRAQALALDDVLLAGLRATSRTPDDFEIVGLPLSDRPEQYALVLPKGDADFKARVDDVLARMFRDGEMARLQQEWFQAAVPPYGHRLGIDPSADALALWESGAGIVE
ncbi:amino acid ABC transporter substrate-binding protein [Pandoraea pnomenusa]|uniref:amino acid ABC transporter substrate-binding protein n=1 Tax=Pandoraea pnomenusa TaxID=93220 RepID=UPI0033417AD6